MSGLSEEQRRRMEENRQRALQKRLKLQASSDGSPSTLTKTSQPFEPARTSSSAIIPEAPVSSYISRPSNPADVVRISNHTDVARGTVSLDVSGGFPPNITKPPQPLASSSTSPHNANINIMQPSFTTRQPLSDTSNNFGQPPGGSVSQQQQSFSFPKANMGFQLSSNRSGSDHGKGSLPSDTRSGNGHPSASCYTSEEARRIEENRRRALERRAASKNSQVASALPVVMRNISTDGPFSTQPKSAASFYNTGQMRPSSDSVRRDKDQMKPLLDNSKGSNPSTKVGSSMFVSRDWSGGGHKGPVAASGVLDSPGKKVSDVGKTQGAKPIFGMTVNGTFRLASTEKFIVDAGFHPQMIDVFKTMDTKMYDPMTQKWNFSVKEHDKLVAALAPLRPTVCISPLPPFVRKILQSLERQVPASCVDLFGLDPKLLEALMPFQHDGVCFGVSRGGRVLIADDMGLGKTIQALGVAVHYRNEWPLLVVTPSSVRYSWLSSVLRWVGSVERDEIVVVGSSRDHFTDATVVIMSYDVLARRAKEVLDHRFKVVILDESHMIKSFKTARYKAAAPVAKEAQRVLLLSGTPALSRPSELYTQIKAIDPKIFPSFQDFGVRYCGGKQMPWGWDFSGSSNMQELKILLEAKFMIRRLKSQVLDQLPAKQRMTVILDPTAVESSNKAMEEAARRLGLKSLTGASRQTALIQYFSQTAHSKLKAVGEYIKELLESDQKFLVFGHHQVMLDMLCDVCDKAKTKYIRIDGRTGGELRQNNVNAFQTKDEVKVAVLSITAASTGLTLTAAQLVVFAELFWNPGVLVQAEDRAHRIGQEDCVVVQYLVGRGTADDYIWPLVQEKLDVLGKAGLSKDNFSDSTSTYQKGIEQNTITQYLLEMQDLDDSSDPTTTTNTRDPNKRQRM